MQIIDARGSVTIHDGDVDAARGLRAAIASICTAANAIISATWQDAHVGITVGGIEIPTHRLELGVCLGASEESLLKHKVGAGVKTRLTLQGADKLVVAQYAGAVYVAILRSRLQRAVGKLDGLLSRLLCADQVRSLCLDGISALHQLSLQ